MAQSDAKDLQSLLQSSQSIAMLLPKNPKVDAVASALALRLVFTEIGKSVHVSCPEAMTVQFNQLVGVDTGSTQFGSRNLIISFPDQTESVDKVSYHIEAGELRLVITPKSGSPPIDHQHLKFIPSSHAEIIILVNVDHFSDLDHIYHDNKDLFHQHTQLIYLGLNPPPENLTPHQLTNPAAISLSEVTLATLETLNLPLSADAATNLLLGLEEATQNFQDHRVTHQTFEAAAKLMRVGARRHRPISPTDFPAGSIPEGPGTAEAVQEFKDTPPSDWYAPKIYRGPMLQ